MRWSARLPPVSLPPPRRPEVTPGGGHRAAPARSSPRAPTGHHERTIDTRFSRSSKAHSAAVFAPLLVVAFTAVAAADDGGAAAREAGKHFQRGVALYGEADYRAALVEFKRAYTTLPNAAVLYNVGEAEYQLQDYASALTTFERYLGETSGTDSHHAEVEADLDVLRARVGHLAIATVPAGADVSVDDQSVGHDPFDKSLLVSIGRRKVVAAMSGHASVTRYVDVAADDNVSQVTIWRSPAPRRHQR